MLARILESETHDDISRGNISLGEENGNLEINITADDVVALRAALNSYLRWTKLALDTDRTIGGIE